MGAVLHEMVTQRGVGVGGKSVIGRLCFLGREAEKCDGISEWGRYKAALDDVVLRLEEICEYLSGCYYNSIIEKIIEILDFISSRETVATAKAMCNGGMRAEQVAAALSGLDDEISSQSFSLVLNRLYGYISEEKIIEGAIYTVEESDIITIFLLQKNRAAGLVVLEEDPLISELAKIMNFSIIIADSSVEKYCGETIILSVDRGIIYISPSVEVLDDFSNSLEKEREKTGTRSNCRFKLNLCEECGTVIDMTSLPLNEENLFKICRGYAENSGEVGVLFLFDSEKIDRIYGRAICRAAVYGRISVAIESCDVSDLWNAEILLKSVCSELMSEGKEFDDNIELGVILRNMCDFISLKWLCNEADFVVADTEWCDAKPGGRKERLLLEFIEEIFLKTENKINRVEIIGDDTLKNVIIGISKEKKAKIFLISFEKNKKKT